MSKSALRLIRPGGRVKFGGKWYQLSPTQRVSPYESDPVYDNRLDGMRAWFYSYGPTAPTLADSIFLHSFPNPDAEDGMDWPGANCIDGKFIWERWREIDAVKNAD